MSTSNMNNYEIIIADNSGFCMGVRNAFEQSKKIAASYPDTVLYGDIVHNSYAINEIIDSGLTINEELNDILASNNIKNVIIRAHGIPPDTEEKLKKTSKQIFDLTCPIVKKVQLLAEKYSSQGHDIILLGKKNHPEVIGIAGYSSKKCYIISGIDEATHFNALLSKPVLMAQTTVNLDVFTQVAAIMKQKHPDIILCNTLCSKTIKTQESALKLANNVDLMIVVGDKKSSNTHSLFERINSITPTIFAEKSEDIDRKMLTNVRKIGITGGSSTPDSQIEMIRMHLMQISEQKVFTTP